MFPSNNFNLNSCLSDIVILKNSTYFVFSEGADPISIEGADPISIFLTTHFMLLMLLKTNLPQLSERFCFRSELFYIVNLANLVLGDACNRGQIVSKNEK